MITKSMACKSFETVQQFTIFLATQLKMECEKQNYHQSDIFELELQIDGLDRIWSSCKDRVLNNNLFNHDNVNILIEYLNRISCNLKEYLTKENYTYFTSEQKIYRDTLIANIVIIKYLKQQLAINKN